jgi:choline dehydrogenase-like flavoprotein
VTPAHGTPERAQVVVVGTGAGGAVVAAELAEAGLDVVMLEEGDRHDRVATGGAPPAALRTLYRDRGLTGAVGNTVIPIPLGCAVGGTTVTNSGTCWRAPEAVLRAWEATSGIPRLAGDGLAPEYARVERRLHVAPVPEALLGPGAALFRRGAVALGLRGGVIARNALGCRGAGVCAFGCPHGAKQSTDVSYVPRALDAGARLHVRTRVERVLTDAGRAAGVLARRLDPAGRADGKPFVVRADAVVLAAGALLTPVLLRRSGIASPTIGRHLRIHPAIRVLALFEEPVRAWEGVPQSYHLHELEPDGIFIQGMFVPPGVQAPNVPGFGALHKARMAAYDRMASFGALVSDTSSGRVLAAGRRPLVWYWLNARDRRQLVRGVSTIARVFFAAGAREVLPGLRQRPVLRSMREAETLPDVQARAADLEVMAFHPLGTARMGVDARTAAVAPSGEVHGVPRLYVADGSILPGSPGLNPQLTIMALATRIAAGMVGGRLSALDGAP